ncbi:OB-fold-like protein [Raphanus sativus]|nr:OB-fold-like protein [Raphanus sativus]
MAAKMLIKPSRGSNDKVAVIEELKPWKTPGLFMSRFYTLGDKPFNQLIPWNSFWLMRLDKKSMQHARGLTLRVRETSYGWLLALHPEFPDLVDFQTVLSGTLDDNLLIDVLGQVVDCGEVETIQCAGGKQRKKLDLILSDINDSQQPCCIWGNLAEKLHSAINQEDRTVTMLLEVC